MAAVALALAAPAAACTKHASQGRLETLLVCPSCHTTLDESDSEVAREMKAEVKQRIAACQSEKQILDAMVAEFGPTILSTPRTSGFDLLAWVIPLGGALAAAIALALGARVWSRTRASRVRRRRPRSVPRTSGGSTRRSSTSMTEKLPIAFLAGLVSVITPCVLPLLPGYLSAISAVEVDRLGERGVSRRIVIASIPFILGFTTVFVLLGAGAAAIGGTVDKQTQVKIAGFVLIVIGLAFIGLLPWPERTVAPGLLQHARRRGSNALLGGAFAVCAAPCIGTVLASILVLASGSGTVARGIVLLIAYSLGLGAAFVLAGVAFAHAMRAFRWVRDHYVYVRIASGAMLVALGLLLFFGRDWWLQVALDQVFTRIGLGTL